MRRPKDPLDHPQEALPGRWTLGSDTDAEAVFPVACGTFGTPDAPQTAVRVFRGPDNAPAGQQLARYDDEDRAAAALDALVDTLKACSPYDPATGVRATHIVGGLPGTSATRIYGELVEAEGRRRFAVERIGKIISAVLGPTAMEGMPPLANAAAAEVAEEAATTVTESTTPVPSGP